MTQFNPPPPQYGFGQQPPQQPYPPGMFPPQGPGGPSGMMPGMPPIEPAGPRRYPIFAPWVLWFSPNVWRDVGRRWRGICFFYLVLLLLLTWLPVMIKGQVEFARFVKDDAPALVNQVPQVTITDGVVSVDKPEPYTITNPKTGEPLVIIDTTGATTQPPPNEPSVLLTRTEVIIRKENGQTQSQDLKSVKSFQIDSTRIAGWLDTARGAILPVGLPALVLFSILWRLAQTLIFAGIGTAIASSSRAPLSYGGLMRLWAVSITPIILIDTAIDLANIPLGCIWTLAGLAAEIVLFVMAIRANAPKAAAMPPMQNGFPPMTR